MELECIIKNFSNYKIEKIPAKIAKTYIKNNHYSKSCHNGPSPCYGLFINEELVGVLCFSTPCSENVRSSVFGSDMKDTVVELHRLHIMDKYKGITLPTGIESWFISRCLKRLKTDRPKTKGVLTFADTSEGHSGVIYKATNAYECGKTSKSTFFLDAKGSLRHPRQNGVNISKEEAKKRGWKPVKRDSKIRYLYLLPSSKGEKVKLKRMCLLLRED